MLGWHGREPDSMADQLNTTESRPAWHVVERGTQTGPLSETELIARIRQGRLGPSALVWRPGYEKWTPIEDTELGVYQPESTASIDGMIPCAQCATFTPIDDTVSLRGMRFCPACKTIQAQCLKEGARVPGSLPIAGFWIRFVALLLDAALIAVINILSEAVLLRLMVAVGVGDMGITIAQIALAIPQFLLFMAYYTWFVGRYGATPGKMMMGLRIVCSNGAPVTYMRALARYFASILSGIILYIGYLMAAMDEERRTLHDRLCDTRVIQE